MNLIDKWKKTEYLKEDDSSLANLLEYMDIELKKNTEQNDFLLNEILSLTIKLYEDEIKHFDFGLIIHCLAHGKEDAFTMYKNLIKNKGIENCEMA